VKEFTQITSEQNGWQKIEANRRVRGADTGPLPMDAALLISHLANEPTPETAHEIGNLVLRMVQASDQKHVDAAVRGFVKGLEAEPVPPHESLHRLLEYMHEKGTDTVTDAEMQILFPLMDRGTRQRLAKDQAKVKFKKAKTGPKS
jgi:hypothetical protein